MATAMQSGKAALELRHLATVQFPPLATAQTAQHALLIRATKGHFGPAYFGPVDYTALYWHLVDLIWIFLFPLLYLIH